MASDILELLANTPDGVYAVDMNQRIVLWNAGSERILGYKAEEALYKRCYQVIGGMADDAVPRCGPNCAPILWARSGKVFPAHDILTRTKHGKSKWISVTHVLLPAAKRELSALVHIFHEVTEQVEAKVLLQRIGKVLEASPPVPVSATIRAEQENGSLNSLTPREREVLRLLARGLSAEAIAQQLTISRATVRNHIQRILAKLDVHNRLEAVVAAAKSGLL